MKGLDRDKHINTFKDMFEDISQCIFDGKDWKSIRYPHILAAIVFTATAIYLHPHLVFIFKESFELEGLFLEIALSIIFFLIPVALWGASIAFTILSIIDLVRWISKRKHKK